MKTLFAAFCVACVACVSFGNEPTPAAAAPQSVVVAQPAADAPAVADDCATCTSESCSTCRSACRNGLFGRTITRTREVTRAAVTAAVVVPVRVAAAPVRCFRARRGCCCR